MADTTKTDSIQVDSNTVVPEEEIPSGGDENGTGVVHKPELPQIVAIKPKTETHIQTLKL